MLNEITVRQIQRHIQKGNSIPHICTDCGVSRSGFAVWTVTNSFWMIYDYQIGAYAQSVLFAVYLGFALWGLWEWRK